MPYLLRLFLSLLPLLDALASTQTFSPASIPLAVRGPFLNTWGTSSTGNVSLANTSATFWTQTIQKVAYGMAMRPKSGRGNVCVARGGNSVIQLTVLYDSLPNQTVSLAGTQSGGSTDENPTSSRNGNDANKRPSHTGSIVGGVVGGIVAVIVATSASVFFLRRARKPPMAKKTRNVSLIQDESTCPPMNIQSFLSTTSINEATSIIHITREAEAENVRTLDAGKSVRPDQASPAPEKAAQPPSSSGSEDTLLLLRQCDSEAERRFRNQRSRSIAETGTIFSSEGLAMTEIEEHVLGLREEVRNLQIVVQNL